MMEKTFTEKLTEIVWGEGELSPTNKELIDEIKELIKTIVPKEFVPRGCIENDEAGGFNDCREEILKALEE